MYVVCRVLLVVFCVLKEYTVRESFGVICSAGVCFGMEERSAQGPWTEARVCGCVTLGWPCGYFQERGVVIGYYIAHFVANLCAPRLVVGKHQYDEQQLLKTLCRVALMCGRSRIETLPPSGARNMMSRYRVGGVCGELHANRWRANC